MFESNFSQGCLGLAKTEIIPFEPGRVMPPREEVVAQQIQLATLSRLTCFIF